MAQHRSRGGDRSRSGAVQVGAPAPVEDQDHPVPSNRGYRTDVMADAETAFRRLFRFELKVVLVFLVVVAAIAAGFFYAAQRHANRQVTVPTLAGLDGVAASEDLQHAGFSRDYVRVQQASEAVNDGDVISSVPAAGAHVSAKTQVTIVFSCGRPIPGYCAGNVQVTVPNLVGLDNVAAAQALQQAGFSTGEVDVRRANGTVEVGHVISSTPGAGATVSATTPVTIVLSCGQPIPGFCSP